MGRNLFSRGLVERHVGKCRLEVPISLAFELCEAISCCAGKRLRSLETAGFAMRISTVFHGRTGVPLLPAGDGLQYMPDALGLTRVDAIY